MKKYLKILPIITFVLLLIGMFPVKSEVISDDFYFLEDKVNSQGEFIKSGIRLEYSTNNGVESEINRLKEIINKQFKEEVNISENTIDIKDEHKEIGIIVWSNKEDTKVQISYINYNNKISTEHLKKELQQVEDFATKNIKYFNFIKVKIIGERKQNILDLLKINIKEDTLEELNILNGKVAKGRLIDGSKINFSFVEYDEEEYLVLGTPVIFITY
ncbi:MAG: hypothetical protein E7212_11070 [Clostridium sartagoforme]|nr:hypothetical protein [Clostridium sartagoforme]